MNFQRNLDPKDIDVFCNDLRVDNQCRKLFSEYMLSEVNQFISTENDYETTDDNFIRSVGKSKRMRSGSVSPPPSTGGLSPPLQDSPGTPPLPSDGRMFPPPFAYKLLEVRTFTYFFVEIRTD